jgi:hypothetical protein
MTQPEGFPQGEQGQLLKLRKEHHGRMKHLDLAYYWLRDEVAKGYIALEYTPTQEQIADIFTKALPCPTVEKLRSMMGIRGS